MSKQNVTVELYYDGEWHDLVDNNEVLIKSPITITRGQSSESIALRPSKITCTLDNTEDKFRTSNPLSPLYGKAGRNTPVRVTVDGVVRGYAELSSLVTDQTQDFRVHPKRGSAWAELSAAGILQRVNQWKEPLHSPLYHYHTTEITNVVGYWPLEDAAGSVEPFSVVDGSFTSTLRGQSFGSQQRPPGSGPVVTVDVIADSGRFYMKPGNGATTDGWQYSVCVYLGSLDNSVWSIINLDLSNDYGVFFTLDDTTNDAIIDVFDETGSQVATQSAAFSGYQWTGRWINIVLEASYSAGTTTYAVYYRAVGEDSWSTFNTTLSADTSSLLTSYTNGMPPSSAYGHVIGVADDSSSLISEDRFAAFEGHSDELTAVRFGRICDLKNIPYYVSTNWAESKSMGPQDPEKVNDIFLSCVRTEDGVIKEHREEYRLLFTNLYDRYRQTPVTLQLTDLIAAPREVNDDLGLRNLVTAKQPDNREAVAEDSTSPLGTQDPPDGVGEYRYTIDVNYNDPDTLLVQAANWWMRKGTVNLPRYPQIAVNLVTLDSATREAVAGLDVGDVLVIQGFRPEDLRLQIIGYTETIGTHSRRIVFNTVPDQQYNVGEYDSENRYDLRTSTLLLEAGRAAGSLFLSMTDDEAWSTSSVPYDLLISGERVTVIAMGSRSGSGPYFQTATVSRATNGLLKVLPAGAEVHIANPGRYAL
jgi:hypothetical protein